MDNDQLLKQIVSLLEQQHTETQLQLKTINARLDKLEAGQESIKQHITANNVAIGEIITQALESSDSKVSKIEKVTKDNLYEIALLKNAK